MSDSPAAETAAPPAVEPIVDFPVKMAYSNSRIGVYEQCPRAFAFEYIEKKPKGPMPPIVKVGGVVHRFIELYFNNCREKKVETDYDAATAFIEQAMASDPELPQLYWDEVEGLCLDFVKKRKFDVQYADGIELKLAIDVNGNPVGWLDKRVFLRGIVDYLRGYGEKVEITDWKSGFNTEFDPFQLKLYALMLAYYFPHVQQFDVYLDFIRMDRSEGMTIYRDDLEKFKRQLRMVIKRIEEDTEFKPRPGRACSWCSFYNICPAGQKEVRVARTEEDAQTVAEQIALTKRRLNDLTEAMQGYCKVAGEVRHNGMAFGYYPTETMSIPADGFLALCERRGVAPADYVSVPTGNKKFRGLIENGAGDEPMMFAEALKLMVGFKKGVKFAEKKAKDDDD